jgi:hypothetical protein
MTSAAAKAKPPVAAVALVAAVGVADEAVADATGVGEGAGDVAAGLRAGCDAQLATRRPAAATSDGIR